MLGRFSKEGKALSLKNKEAQAREMSTLKEQVAFLMRLMPGLTCLQVQDGCNDPPDVVMTPLIRLLHMHIKDHCTQVMTSNVLLEVIGRSSQMHDFNPSFWKLFRDDFVKDGIINF